MVVIQIDAVHMNKLLNAVRNIRNGVPKVLVPAINRTLTKGRTEVKREIRKIYTIKAKDIPVKINKASPGTLGGSVVVKDTMLDLNKFQVTPRTVTRGRRQRAVHATVRKGSGGYIGGAFIAQMPSGYLGPFRRVGPERLPIKKLLAIGAGIMASQPSVGPAVNKAMGAELDKRIDHEIKRVLATAER